jgi:hypothetical protein
VAIGTKSKPATKANLPETGYASVDQRRAKGRALRERVSRTSHAGWKPPARRQNPTETLKEGNAAACHA